MVLQRILALERLLAPVPRADERLFVAVASVMVLQVVRDHERLSASRSVALVRPLVGVRAQMFAQIAPRGEDLIASGPVAVEGVAGVQARVRVQTVERGKCGSAAGHGADEWLLARVDAHVHLQTVSHIRAVVIVPFTYRRRGKPCRSLAPCI